MFEGLAAYSLLLWICSTCASGRRALASRLLPQHVLPWSCLCLPNSPAPLQLMEAVSDKCLQAAPRGWQEEPGLATFPIKGLFQASIKAHLIFFPFSPGMLCEITDGLDSPSWKEQCLVMLGGVLHKACLGKRRAKMDWSSRSSSAQQGQDGSV